MPVTVAAVPIAALLRLLLLEPLAMVVATMTSSATGTGLLALEAIVAMPPLLRFAADRGLPSVVAFMMMMAAAFSLLAPGGVRLLKSESDLLLLLLGNVLGEKRARVGAALVAAAFALLLAAELAAHLPQLGHQHTAGDEAAAAFRLARLLLA